MRSVADALLAGDPALFTGDTARHALGWLDHVDRYLGEWLDRASVDLPRRHERVLLLGMGGSSSPARFYADERPGAAMTVLDTSNPDTVAATDFSRAMVIASSKSGTTVETQTLLAHALAHGANERDVVVITDPGTTLDEWGRSAGAHVIHGDPATGGRYSALSPFGLVPALYCGWTPEELRAAHRPLDRARVEDLIARAESDLFALDEGTGTFGLRGDPATSGGALWLEQLVAESTGKVGRGYIPLVEGEGERYRVAEMLDYQVLTALLARRLGVDPFDQPNVESAKRAVFRLLGVGAEDPVVDGDDPRRVLASPARFRTLQVYGPIALAEAVAPLRAAVERVYGPTTANLGPRYLHSTGQLHKGGPSCAAVQVIVRPRTAPQRIQGRHYSFHDLHRAQARADLLAMREAGRAAAVVEVDDLDEARALLGAE